MQIRCRCGRAPPRSNNGCRSDLLPIRTSRRVRVGPSGRRTSALLWFRRTRTKAGGRKPKGLNRRGRVRETGPPPRVVALACSSVIGWLRVGPFFPTPRGLLSGRSNRQSRRRRPVPVPAIASLERVRVSGPVATCPSRPWLSPGVLALRPGRRARHATDRRIRVPVVRQDHVGRRAHADGHDAHLPVRGTSPDRAYQAHSRAAPRESGFVRRRTRSGLTPAASVLEPLGLHVPAPGTGCAAAAWASYLRMLSRTCDGERTAAF